MRTKQVTKKNRKKTKKKPLRLAAAEHAGHVKGESIENEFDAVLHSIGDGVIVVNKKLEIALFNPAAEQMTGYSQKEALGQPLRNILHIKTAGTQRSPIDISVVLSKRQTVKVCNYLFLVQKNGDVVPMTYCAAPVNGHPGAARGAVLTLRDVSREHEINKMKSEFVSIVSHQLRTPLSAIKWFLETLIENRRQEPITERQHDYLEQAFQSNERMILLINDLLNVSRLEAGKVKNTPELTDVSAIFQSVMREMETFAHANNVKLECRFCEKKLPQLFVDPAKLRQVIQNLISNAVKYTRGKETVVVDGTVKKSEIIFSIRDQGIGIPPIDQHRLFEPFFRAENAIATQAEGSGLGLYICKMLLEFNGGRIWVKSEVGEGTTFFFALPRHQKPTLTK